MRDRSARLQVDVIGNGPPLVLLHGWAMHGGIFAPLVELLSARHSVHVVDLPGHGHNRDCGVSLELEACTQAILDVVPDAPWCGWSLGGSIALHAAATQPQRVRALAMICATVPWAMKRSWKALASKLGMRDRSSGSISPSFT